MSRRVLLQSMLELDAQRQEIAEQLAESRGDALAEVSDRVDDLLDEEGFARSDLIVFWGASFPVPQSAPDPGAAVAERKPRKPNGNGTITYVHKFDPSKTYCGKGPTPGWMRHDMSVAGLDHTNKEDREQFRREYMVPAMEA